VIVSGLPRSGTSLMMQMLEAGGLPALSDGLRAPDADNPRGYLEWEPVKRLGAEPELLERARGRALKVVSALLRELPRRACYHVIFMQRPVAAIQASQLSILRRLGLEDDGVGEEQLSAHLDEVLGWLRRQENVRTCFVAYGEALAKPREVAGRVREFLGLDLDVERMAAAVDSALRHHGEAGATSR
jgi:hypothetical protein